MDERRPEVQHAVVNDGVVYVAGHEECFEMGMVLPQPVDQHFVAHVGHDYVRDGHVGGTHFFSTSSRA